MGTLTINSKTLARAKPHSNDSQPWVLIRFTQDIRVTFYNH